jgi:hypothetical protein
MKRHAHGSDIPYFRETHLGVVVVRSRDGKQGVRVLYSPTSRREKTRALSFLKTTVTLRLPFPHHYDSLYLWYTVSMRRKQDISFVDAV